jgi:hypothetical protein
MPSPYFFMNTKLFLSKMNMTSLFFRLLYCSTIGYLLFSDLLRLLQIGLPEQLRWSQTIYLIINYACMVLAIESSFFLFRTLKKHSIASLQAAVSLAYLGLVLMHVYLSVWFLNKSRAFASTSGELLQLIHPHWWNSFYYGWFLLAVVALFLALVLKPGDKSGNSLQVEFTSKAWLIRAVIVSLAGSWIFLHLNGGLIDRLFLALHTWIIFAALFRTRWLAAWGWHLASIPLIFWIAGAAIAQAHLHLSLPSLLFCFGLTHWLPSVSLIIMCIYWRTLIVNLHPRASIGPSI